MGIIRTRLAFERDFVQIPNAWLRDERLSRRARGLLAEIMTHKAGWEVSVDSLVAKGTEGRDAIRGAINELEDAGYLIREQGRDSSNRFGGTVYHIQDPHVAVSPSSVFPSSESPSSGNQPTKNTILKEHHPEEHEEELFAVPAKPPVVQSLDDDFAEWYGAYPKKVAKGAAQRAYAKARKRPGVSRETLLDGAKAYAANPARKPDFTKHPASWLNDECWLDEHTRPTAAPWEQPRNAAPVPIHLRNTPTADPFADDDELPYGRP